MRLGVHVSISGTIDRAVDRAVERGCGTFQLFSRNPRSWVSKDLVPRNVEAFLSKLQVSGIDPVVDHMPYLPNLASPKVPIYEKSVSITLEEVQRCRQLSIPYLVLHLGSHLGEGRQKGLKLITDALSRALDLKVENVQLLLENTSGGRHSMGSSFEEIGEIIDLLDGHTGLGVCFDTCHAFAAGYDLRTSESLGEVMDGLDEMIGVERLKVVHLNDSFGELGSGKDRHEHIGLGKIGVEGLTCVLGHESIRNRPLILETPIDHRGDDYKDLARAKELYWAANRTVIGSASERDG